MSLSNSILMLNFSNLSNISRHQFSYTKELNIKNLELSHFNNNIRQFIKVSPFVIFNSDNLFKILKSNDEFIPVGFIESDKFFKKYNIFDCMATDGIPECFRSIINSEGRNSIEELECRENINDLFSKGF